MTDLQGKTVGIIGALAAFPRRLAAREVARRGGHLRRGASTKTSMVVFGRGMIGRYRELEIERRVEEQFAVGRQLTSENGFLRVLGFLDEAEAGAVSSRGLRDQSGLSEHDARLLCLFDVFARDREPYTLRDVILARKFSGLIAGGASWADIVASVHRHGTPMSLTALSLHMQKSGTIFARFEERLGELDGQYFLPIPTDSEENIEELFVAAEDAEASGHYEKAGEYYLRCLNLDPGDSVAAFNRANCLRSAGKHSEAARAYLQAIKHDPEFVDAWFNFAGLRRDAGEIDAARRYLQKTIALDGAYCDAVYNLAALEFDAGNLDEARSWWLRYLELDNHSDWAKNATRGVQYVDMHNARKQTG